MTTKTWTGATGDYSLATNWNPNGEPTAGDTAIFGSIGVNKLINIAFATDVDEWLFNGGAYTLDLDIAMNLHGAGILVASGGSALIQIGANGLTTGDLVFQNGSSAGSATILADKPGAGATFTGNSDGGTARLIAADPGSFFDFSGSAGPNGDNKIAAGSIEGAGSFDLANGQVLSVGDNNRSTIVTGGVFGGIGSSLTKVGTGTMTLAGNDAFLGALTLQGGTVDLASAGADSANSTVFAGSAATLRIENAALPDNNFAPIVEGFTGGDAFDLPGLPFVPGATTTSYSPTLHALFVTSGATTITFDSVAVVGNNLQFVALDDDAGGTRVMLGILGTAGNNLIDAIHHPAGQHSSNGGPDVILGLGGNDTIKGLGGNDILVGGPGADHLFGGPGADTFVYRRLVDSRPVHPDVIEDFKHVQHDKIDLYDLFHAAHHVALRFIGAETFAQYHHVHPAVFGMVRYAGGEVQVNVNHNLGPDLAIVMNAAPALHAGDFVL